MAPEFIYFDMGNVLLPFDRDRQWRQLAEVSGVSAERVREVLEGPIHDAVESGEITTRDGYERFCEATGTRPDMAEAQRAGNDIFWVNHSILPLLCQLRRAGHRMGILSNTSESHWQFICDRRYRILPAYFEISVLSYEVGVMKPAAKIYEAAIEAAGVPAEKIFFMDDREENVTGAIECGMDAALFTDTPMLIADLAKRGIELAI